MADLSDQQLREELSKFDVAVNKVTDKNRGILIKKLNHLRVRQGAAEEPPSPPKSPGRRSPGRAKKSSPRRSIDPVVQPFYSSDDNDLTPGANASTTQRLPKNLRRRTVDSGSTNGEMNDVDVAPRRTRGMMANIEPILEPGKSKRQSLGASANSPFPAGSLRNPLVREPGASGQPRLRSSRMNDLMHDDDVSSSDDGYSFTEVATTGVNTSASLYDMVDNKSPSKFGYLRSQQGKSKLWIG